MAISHADHDHANTPAARSACRKRMAAGQSPRDDSAERALGNIKMTGTTARKLARQAAKADMVKISPRVKSGDNKKPGTVLRTIGDLPDVPPMLAYGARLAWANDWKVTVGHPFNDSEARIVIEAPAGEIALVWKHSLPNGIWGVFFRAGYGSVTTRADSVQEAFELGTLEK